MVPWIKNLGGPGPPVPMVFAPMCLHHFNAALWAKADANETKFFIYKSRPTRQ
jgi:hypothetical protein